MRLNPELRENNIPKPANLTTTSLNSEKIEVKGKRIVLLPLGLPGMGKTHLIKLL